MVQIELRMKQVELEKALHMKQDRAAHDSSGGSLKSRSTEQLQRCSAMSQFAFKIDAGADRHAHNRNNCDLKQRTMRGGCSVSYVITGPFVLL